MTKTINLKCNNNLDLSITTIDEIFSSVIFTDKNNFVATSVNIYWQVIFIFISVRILFWHALTFVRSLIFC